MQKILSLTITLFIVSLLAAQNGKDPVKVTDMLKIKTPGNVTISKDGSKAAFILTTIEPDGDSKTEYKYVTQIWIAATDGSSAPKQLTSKENSSQPAFSPDGKQIAFSRFVDGKPQIFLLPLDGGEAIQLTKHKYGASNARWSPDGKQLLFSATISLKELLKDSIVNPSKDVPKWSMEKPGLENNQYLKSTAKADPDGNIE